MPNRVVQQAGWMMAATVVAQIAAVGTMLTLAAELGVNDFGRLATALAFQGLISTITHNGLRHPLIRELIANPARFDALASSYVLLCLGLAALASLTTIVVVMLLPLQTDETWLWIVIAAGNLANALQPNPIFDALRKPAVTTVVAALVEIVGWLAIVLLVALGKLSLILAAVIVVLKWTVTTVVLWNVLSLKHRRLQWSFDPAAIMQLCRSGVWVGSASLLQASVVTSSTIVARVLGGTEAAAFLGLGSYAFRAHQMIFTLINRLISPVLADRIARGVGYHKLLFGAAGISVVLGMAGIVSATIVIWLVLPESYAASGSIVGLLLCAATIRHPAMTVNLMLIMRQRERWGLVAALVFAATFATWSFWSAGLSDAERAASHVAWGLVVASAAFAMSILLRSRADRSLDVK